jgi:hypothetical protein
MSTKRSRSLNNRREFLKTLGLAAGSTALSGNFFGNILGSTTAEAAGSTYPLRLLNVYISHPPLAMHYYPKTAPGALTDTSLNFAYSALKPLDKYRDRMMIIRGTALPQHESHNGTAGWLTGAKTSDTNIPMNSQYPSIDLFLGDRVIGNRSKNLLIGGGYIHNGTPVSFEKNAVPVLGKKDPVGIYGDICKAMGVPFNPTDTSSTSALSQKLALRRLASTYARNSLARISTKLGQTEQVKVDAYIQSLSDLESRITQGLASQTSGCGRLPQPSFLGYRNQDNTAVWYENGPWGALNGSGYPDDGYSGYRGLIAEYEQNYFSLTSPTMLDLITGALRCDAARFITFSLNGQGWTTIRDLNHVEPNGEKVNLVTNPHDDLAHLAFTDSEAGLRVGRILSSWYAYQLRQLVALMDRLAAVPEGDGTLLDHTLIFLGGDLGVGCGSGHGTYNLQNILIGDANKYFKTGQYFSLVQGKEETVSNYDPYSLMPRHSQLLLSICRAFGVTNVNTFNDTATGEITALKV